MGMRIKTPGERMSGTDVELCLIERDSWDMPPYQRLLGDAMRGVRELFAREDLVDAQWRAVGPILGDVTPLYQYDAGTWGPVEAKQLIAAEGQWVAEKTASQNSSNRAP
jgi:glucose-6-phosphate 1-dehydrogenase